MCDTRLTFYTVSLLIYVEFCSIEEFNLLCYFFSKMFSHDCLSNLSRTDILWDGNGLLVEVIFFMGVSILTTSSWIFVAIITVFR